MYNDTSKGRYFASINKDLKNNYSVFHKQYIEFIERNMITIFDYKEYFYGCGGLIKYNGCNLLLTADHVISCIKQSNLDSKIKVPINYINNLESKKQESLVSTISKDTYYGNSQYDFGVFLGFDSLKEDGYEFIELNNDNIGIPKNGNDILLIGIPDKRIVKAIHKTKHISDENVLVNGFQLPTIINKVTEIDFEISYPTTFYIYNEDSDDVREARSPDPSGMSGSFIWSYNKNKYDLKLLGLVIEGVSEGIKCIRSDIIFDTLKNNKM
jgi:hypothetical protein